ncbi:MAG: beta-ketoacyl-[acyl-carrier-protein] synthase family protein [Opitutales bacterium]|nr:beta-ketoacyl-[acyl-carrier-protein] synthase family protein [Opitutales bacterium]
MNKKSVVITGLGFITSIGNSKAEVLKSLAETISGIELYKPFEADSIPVKCLGTVKNFDTESNDPEDWTYPEEYHVRREVLRGFSPHVLYAYCAMKQAVADAGLSDDEVSNLQTGMYTASGGSVGSIYANMQRLHSHGVMRASPMGVVSSVVGTLSFNLVSAFKIKGASCGFASACASSSHAMGFAYEEIASGRQKRMFVVGGEDGDFSTILPFAGMRALSLSKDPSKASRPYDKHRDGFVGTGGGVVAVLEDEETARNRGAKIYARFLGWGQASDGFNVAIPHPEGDGLYNAMKFAFDSVSVSPSEVGYINSHGTSTQIGDIAELKAVARFFGEGAKVPISSTKSITGHGLSLAGVMESGFCALCLENSFIPASANIEELDERAQNFDIVRKTRFENPKLVLSLSSGFGGANTALLFGKA